MSSPERRDTPKMPASVKDLKPNDRLALAATLIGIVVVALGLTLESYFGGLGTGIRALGGVIFLIGISAFVLGDARRRAAVQSKVRQLVARYVARTAHWGWPDRWGVAAVAIGLILVVPMVALQIMFDTTFGVVVIGVGLFWAGIGLLIYGRFYRKGSERDNRPTTSSPRSGSEYRGGDRVNSRPYRNTAVRDRRPTTSSPRPRSEDRRRDRR